MSESLHYMDFSLPGSYIHGISQGRSLEWVTIPFTRGSSWPDQIWVACLAGTFLTDWTTREVPTILYLFSYWKVSKSVNSLLLWTNIVVFTHSCFFLGIYTIIINAESKGMYMFTFTKWFVSLVIFRVISYYSIFLQKYVFFLNYVTHMPKNP